MERRLQLLCGRQIAVTPAGRTDAGVHALGQVVHCDLPAQLSPVRIVELLGEQGEHAAVVAARTVTARFHARYSALRRTYIYLIRTAGRATPFDNRYAVSISLRPGEMDRMEEAAGLLVGLHDFAAFALDARKGGTRRRVHAVTVHREENFLAIRFCANAYLRCMIRIAVGALIAVAKGDREPEWIQELLAEHPPLPAAPPAAPRGLYLAHVAYPPDLLALPEMPRSGNAILDRLVAEAAGQETENAYGGSGLGRTQLVDH